MRISIGQIIILLLISFLLFGDIQNLKNKLKDLLKKIKEFLEK
uniref:Sec-independent protein translocase component tatA/E n=1 Tax=Pseudo-nitzschia delicatissima TaxID=44447 RepID=A0A8B6QMX7_9STRA|nr:Sec-independent protein translocase component tatA/E [Pseudo-nitzschia delicatissima]QTJ30070.1 Sec-independent protein translocase component tatA/E [Pseudo-nitzschia delicatissima]